MGQGWLKKFRRTSPNNREAVYPFFACLSGVFSKEMDAAAVYLASPLAAYTTGARWTSTVGASCAEVVVSVLWRQVEPGGSPNS